MPGIKEQRTEIALWVLKRAVNHFRKSYYDPSELESLGYMVIAENLNRKLKNNKKWKEYIEICLRNAMRQYIKKQQRQKQITHTVAVMVRRSNIIIE